MPELRYEDIRSVEPGTNPFTTFRPSGNARILKGTLEYTTFQVALTYGFAFHGFGIHSYFFQTIGTYKSFGPFARTKTLAASTARYLALSLPFFCILIITQI